DPDGAQAQEAAAGGAGGGAAQAAGAARDLPRLRDRQPGGQAPLAGALYGRLTCLREAGDGLLPLAVGDKDMAKLTARQIEDGLRAVGEKARAAGMVLEIAVYG